MTSPAATATTDRVPAWLVTTAALIWRLAVVAIGLYLAVAILARLRVIVLPVIAALLLTSVLSPPVRWLERRGMPSLGATALVFFGFLGALAAFFAYAGPQVAHQVGELSGAVEQTVQRGRSWLTDGPFHFSDTQVDRWGRQLIDEIRGNRNRLASGVLAGATLLFEIVTGIVVTLFLTFFFVKDGPRMWGWIRSQVAGQARRDVDEAGRRAWATLGAYIRGSAIAGLIEATLKAIALVVLGVPLVVPLAALTFFGGFLPLVGAVTAGLVSASVALAAKGPTTAGLVLLASVLIQNVDGHLIQPLVMGRLVKLHPVVIAVALTGASAVAGLIGAFLAVPTVSVAVAVLTYYRHDRTPGLATPGGEPLLARD